MEQEELSTELAALLPRLWRFALRLAGDRHDAEDLVQRACVRALERRGSDSSPRAACRPRHLQRFDSTPE